MATNLKLAEALLLRADMQTKLHELKHRLEDTVKVQEGDTPAEDPALLIAQSTNIIDELYALIHKITRTNAAAMMADGTPLAQALNERDRLKEQHKLLKFTIDNAKDSANRYSLREIKWQSTVDIAKLHKQADDIAKQLRDLNLKIQAQNWLIDLME